jgi:hypothetical protein
VTLSEEPTTHISNLSGDATSASRINLTWDAATGADGYLIVVKAGSAPTNVINDATSYSFYQNLADGKVAGIITDGLATTGSAQGLLPNTEYQIKVFPFGFNGTNIESYNYKTDGSIPTVIVSTLEGRVESFSSEPFTASYNAGSFSGDGGIIWNYVRTRNEDTYGIDGAGALFQNNTNIDLA